MKNLLIIGLFISSFLFTFSSVIRAQPISNYLQASFEFTNGSFFDGSPNMVNGIGTDLSSSMGIEGSLNGAYSYNGSSSFIDLGTDNRNVTDQLTISVWINTSATGRRIIVSKYNVSEDKGYSISIQDGMASMEGRDGSGAFYQILSGNYLVNDGQWHHIVGVMDGNLWRLYVDCELVNGLNTGTDSPDFTNTVPIAIGRLSVANNLGDFRYFEGIIDNFKLYNFPLSEEQLENLSLYNCPIGSPDIVSGLVAYYPLDGNALDESGNDLHGTLNGPIPATDRFGLSNTCLEFDGEDDYIQVVDATPLQFGTGPFAVSLWLKADNPEGGPQMLIHKGASGPGPQLWLRVNDFEIVDPSARLKGAHNNDSPMGIDIDTDQPVFDDRDWHHVVYQRRAGYLELWVDGVNVAQLANTEYRNINTPEGMIIGAQNPWPAGGNIPFIHNHFDGYLDELRLYNKALSPDEIYLVANTYCPQELVIDSDPDFQFYQASEALSTSGTVTVSENTIFQAGINIILKPGFSVQSGLSFIGKIEDCTPSINVATQEIPVPKQLTENTFLERLGQKLTLKIVPNPFRSALQIKIDLNEPQQVQLKLLDMNGKQIKQIFSERLLEAGENTHFLDVADLLPGMYFLNLQTANQQLTKKIIKIR